MASSDIYKPAGINDASIQGPNASQLATPNRRALGDVSPNVRKTSPATAMLTRKPLTGSPLKRSFNAALESGEGLTYLKRRKLSEHESLSDRDTAHQRRMSGGRELDGAPSRPFLSPEDDVPTLAEPIDAPSPTEPNTPSEEGSTEHSSAERKSFSSLINYDPSSQTSNPAVTGVSRAEMLRLRLRIAMYKVRTNQTHLPFAKLRLEAKPPTRSQAVEEAVAILRREAQQQHQQQQQKQALASEGQPTSVPRLLPGPTLRPTAYSSRMIYDSNVSSSPPSASPERLPVASTSAALLTPQRGGAGRMPFGTPGTAGRFAGPSEQELTSSVVKGRVAEGLLDLRNAI